MSLTCPTISLTPTVVPDGALGVSYIQILTASGGTGPHTFAVTSGSLPAGLSLSSDGTLSGMATALGSYGFTITARDANGCTGAEGYSVDIQPSGSPLDITAPVVKTTSPTNRSILSTAAISVSGTARDVGTVKTGVALVLYSLNGSATQIASTGKKFANWTANVTLQPGWNSFTAQALDNRGNASALASSIFYYGPIGNVVGTYSGLFYQTDGKGTPIVDNQSDGAVLGLAVNSAGAYSGKIYVGAKGYTLKGKFDLAGNSAVTVSRASSGKADLAVSLNLDWTGVSRQVTGTVSCAGEGWSSPLEAVWTVK